MTEEHAPETNAWWGTFDIDAGSRLERVVGPLRLTVERNNREWRVIADRSEPGVAPGDPAIDRFVIGETQGPLRLVPVVADRAVITEPLTPLHLVPGGLVGPR